MECPGEYRRPFADPRVFDLKRTEPPIPTLLNLAITKAKLAYGPAIVSDPNNAIDHLRDNPHRLDDCMRELQLCDTPKAVLWDRINA